MNEQSKIFCVVGRSRASFFIKPDEKLILSVNDSCNPRAIDFCFQTHLVDRGFETPIPEGLRIEARGTASDLKSAIEQYTNKANDLAGILSVSANAYIPPIEAELSFDDTPGIQEHEYFQSFVKEDQPTEIPNRTLDCEMTLKFFGTVANSIHQARLMRAIGQYSAALGHWRPGAEMMCVAHCFMGIEALKPVALERHRLQTGLSKEQLACEWGFAATGRQKLNEFLDVQVRERVLFNGDQDCRRKTKKVSDDFEHGLSNFSELHPIAREVVVPTARYLRTAILTLSGLQETEASALINGYEQPRGPVKVIKYVWGRLQGAGGALAQQGQAYPYLRWQSKLLRVWRDNQGKYSTRHDDNMTAVLGDGVKLTPERTEVWDGSIVRTVPIPTQADQ